jgi:hypothetical protein
VFTVVVHSRVVTSDWIVSKVLYAVFTNGSQCAGVLPLSLFELLSVFGEANRKFYRARRLSTTSNPASELKNAIRAPFQRFVELSAARS